jgi:hypothetical protein
MCCAQSYKRKLTLQHYFTAAPHKLAGSDILSTVLDTLQQAISEGIRLKCMVDFEVVRMAAEVLRERSSIFTEIASKYLTKTREELMEQGILHNSIKQIDLLISEAKDKLRHSPVTVGPV